MQNMTLGDDLIRGIANGKLSAAIWHGRQEVSVGPLRLHSPAGESAVEVSVSDVRHKPFVEVDDVEARRSGEADRESLWQVLSRTHPDMTHTDEVTIAILG